MGQQLLACCERGSEPCSQRRMPLFTRYCPVGKSRRLLCSSANDVAAAIEWVSGHSLRSSGGQPALVLCMMATTAHLFDGAGRLHEAERLIQQALLMEMPSAALRLA